MTSVQGRSCPVRKSRASKALTSLSSHRSDQDLDREDPLRYNKPSAGPYKAFAPAEPPQTQGPPHKISEMNVAQFIQKDLDQII